MIVSWSLNAKFFPLLVPTISHCLFCMGGGGVTVVVHYIWHLNWVGDQYY